MPRAVARPCLPGANARIELARAAMAVSAPLAVGLLAQHGLVVHAYLGAALASGLAALALLPLRIARPAAPAAVDSLFATVRAGAAFVATQPLLRGIAICAVLWNFAFFALTASFVPFAMERLGLGPAGTGVALAAYGAGAVLAGLTGGRLVSGVEPRHMLMFGPGVSTIAGGALWLAAGVGGDAGLGLAVLAWFLIGFGPILWLICQTTIRRLVTPAALMGRVGATIQIPIYGIRPLGAIAGGLVAAHAGPAAAVVLVLAVFALSTAVIALSPALRALRALPGPVLSPAAA